MLFFKFGKLISELVGLEDEIGFALLLLAVEEAKFKAVVEAGEKKAIKLLPN